MNKKLFSQAIGKVVAGIVLVGLLLFVPAGSFAYWQGWLLMGILFIPMLIAGFVMMAKSPELLKKRLNAKEEQSEQKTVITLSALMFISAFVVAGLNFRFGWLSIPNWLVFTGLGMFLASYMLYAEVLRENTYLSRTQRRCHSRGKH